MHHTPKHHPAPKPETDTPHRWLLPLLLVAQLMVILDITAVNIALPHIARDLRLSGASCCASSGSPTAPSAAG